VTPAIPDSTSAKSRRAAAQHKESESLLEFLASIAGVLVVGLFVITFVMQTFEIPSASMEKTLLIGDHVVVGKTALAPPAKWFPLIHYRQVQHGDVIVFLKPGEPDFYLVKRVIGLPGDRIHLKDGVVYRNGEALKERYAATPADGPQGDQYNPYRDDFPSVPPEDGYNVTAQWSVDLPTHIQNGDLVVPPDKYFAMGDNRPVSLDSRYWGFVPRANIIGSPLFIYWSFITPDDQYLKTSIGQRLGFILHVIVHFFDETRWSRCFRLVH
jgi:signal peptidase I